MGRPGWAPLDGKDGVRGNQVVRSTLFRGALSVSEGSAGNMGEWYLHMNFRISEIVNFQTWRASSAVKFRADHFNLYGL